jgi:hypothetical protein
VTTLTRIGANCLCRTSWRCWRARRSPSRARRAGGKAFQLSGRRSTNSRSPAAMEFMVTLRASAIRIALPSGSRRAAAR